jgi:transcriptional regulator with XRE-family HTH domain
MHFTPLNHFIKARRDELQISQQTLADLSGVGLRTLKQFESGNGNPTIKTITQIAEVLGLELCLQVKSNPSNL